MRVTLRFGRQMQECEVRDADLIDAPPRVPIAPVADIGESMRTALEVPADYPPLRRAFTPDDQVTIVVDERLPHLVELLVPLLEHITQAGVATSAVTLLCPRSESRQEWLEDLPDSFQDVR